jgi:polar amino acid transport system permease protein
MRELVAWDLVFLTFAARWTVLLSIAAFAGGALIGLGTALARVSPAMVPRYLAMGYIRLFQGTPLLVQLFVVFFGAEMAGLSLAAWPSAVLALSLHAGAFLGEIWRSAIESVPKGQTEAARSLGLAYVPCMAKVILPQAVRIAVPPTVGFVVHLVKSTSLAALIGVVELSRAGQLLNSTTFRPFLIFGTVAAVYFLICLPTTIVSRQLEIRLARPYRR